MACGCCAASGRPEVPPLGLGDDRRGGDGLAGLRGPLAELATAAGRAILEVYRGEFAVRHKADASPLTEADLRSQALLQAGLERLWPGVPLLAEEGDPVPYEERRAWARLWSVDPLDGTREFVARSGEFSVNVGLVEAARPVFGVIHAPLQALTFAGGPGLGAWRRDGEGAWTPVRTAAPTGRTLRVFASRHHAGPRTLAWIRSLADDWDVEELRRGSAVKACFVADGSAHLYARLGTTYEWDTAAAQAILEGAGGVLNRAGTAEPLIYNKPDVRNPDFYAAWGPDAPHP
jgi:3'(2'), 5'-bisphosphate nucleotidase